MVVVAPREGQRSRRRKAPRMRLGPSCMRRDQNMEVVLRRGRNQIPGRPGGEEKCSAVG